MCESNQWCLLDRRSQHIGMWPSGRGMASEEENLTLKQKLMSLRVPPDSGLKWASEKDEQASTSHVALIEATAPSTVCIDFLWTFEMWASGFISSYLHCAGAALWTMGTLKAKAFGLFVPNGCMWGPQLAHSYSALWSDVTLRRHYPHHYASLPLRTGNRLWQPSPLQPDWTSDPLTRSHKDGDPIHHYYMQTSGLCNLDIDTRFWISFSMSSAFFFKKEKYFFAPFLCCRIFFIFIF